MKLKCLLISGSFLLFLQLAGFSQEDDLSYMIKQIKENYPGFHDKTTEKEYDLFVSKILAMGNQRDSLWKMSQIAGFFADEHLKVFRKWPKTELDSAACRTKAEEISRYFESDRKLDNYEGLWLNDYADCIVALKKESDHPLMYKAYVVESRDNYFLRGQVVCQLEKQKDIFFTRFLSNIGRYEIYVNSRFRNDSVLVTGRFGKWKKLNDYHYPYLPEITPYSLKAALKKINDSTVLITIPICNGRNVSIVDSLVKANRELLSHCRNMIVDARNNLGGSVRAYYPLLPYIYTNPIKKVDGYLYCSPAFINEAENELASYKAKSTPDSIKIARLTKQLADMKAHAGGFVFDPDSSITFNAVMPFPKNVGLLINYGCVSAGELMCFAFRQSSKVTVFGENTYGVVDYLDDYTLNAPSKNYFLFMPGTKRAYTKREPKVDGKGIEPDVRIPDTEKDWVRFVTDYYDKRN